MGRPLSEPLVRAAGGVITRPSASGELEVVLVHRPRYDDWTLPKGKRDPGETDEQCAVREIDEETGLRCRLGRELLPVGYVDGRGRPKIVRYWAMTVMAERERAPDDEVDEIRWVALRDAAAALTYARDVDVVRSLSSTGVRGWGP